MKINETPLALANISDSTETMKKPSRTWIGFCQRQMTHLSILLVPSSLCRKPMFRESVTGSSSIFTKISLKDNVLILTMLLFVSLQTSVCTLDSSESSNSCNSSFSTDSGASDTSSITTSSMMSLMIAVTRTLIQKFKLHDPKLRKN